MGAWVEWVEDSRPTQRSATSQDDPQSTIPDGLTPAPMGERVPFLGDYSDSAYEIALIHLPLSDVLALKLAHDAVRALK